MRRFTGCGAGGAGTSATVEVSMRQIALWRAAQVARNCRVFNKERFVVHVLQNAR